ncbi:MAG: polysaccharide deacetylase family protein [Armatimonadetes bacterium]|nr:polysaccharide deacetylase family protein [Armatimonadota bacterium]
MPHIVTLSFDDGFMRSSYRTAEVFEAHGLRACINVVASWCGDGFGCWDDWNALRARGHEIGVHTWDHTNLAEIPLDDAKRHVDRCRDDFAKSLEGFNPAEAVYNFAYNASTPEVEEYVLSQFHALRTAGVSAVNPVRARRITCWSHGPENCDAFFDQVVSEFLMSSGGWLVFNGHGLDDEGWGPMSTSYLDNLLARLVRLDHVAVLPARDVLFPPPSA